MIKTLPATSNRVAPKSLTDHARAAPIAFFHEFIVKGRGQAQRTRQRRREQGRGQVHRAGAVLPTAPAHALPAAACLRAFRG